MIHRKAIVVYELFCDGCSEQFEDTGLDLVPIYLDPSEAIEAADCHDWIEQDGKHYCLACRPNNQPV